MGDFIVPRELQETLQQIAKGAKPADLESATLDFKEDPAAAHLRAARVNGAQPQPGKNDAKAAENLIDAAICFANGEEAVCWIVFGVNDKQAGSSAFTGTNYPLDWVRDKIYNGTKPNLRVEAAEITVEGRRLIVVKVLQGLSLYTRSRGESWYRDGNRCVPMSEEKREMLKMQRANPDYTAKLSACTVADAELVVLTAARQARGQRLRLQGKSDGVDVTDSGFLRELGLTTASASDMLTEAGRILLTKPQLGVSVRYLWREFPGAEPEATELKEPMFTALQRTKELIKNHGRQQLQRIAFSDGQEVAIPELPEVAIDEIVTNAFVHRDWRMSGEIVVDQTPGILKVYSPGGLPYGVTVDNLLTTPSVPRNRTLLTALWELGLAEQSSRGFDRIWAAMLRTGRPAPEIKEEGDLVLVRLQTSSVDTEFIKAITKLARVLGEKQVGSVNFLIVAQHVLKYGFIDLRTLEKLTQTGAAEAMDIASWLVQLQFLVLQEASGGWTLAPRFAELLGVSSSAAGTLAERVLEELSGPPLEALTLAKKLGVQRKEVTDVLRLLRTEGKVEIKPDGPQRGKNTRWQLV